MDEEKKYDYRSYSCQANGYTSDVVFGSKMGSSLIGIPTGTEWGAGGGSVMAPPQGLLPVPDTINMYYYSLPENQFWKLKAPLPKERIQELFEKKYTSLRGGKDLEYIGLTAGMAPCGFVTIWMVGDAGSVLIDTLQAERTIMDYNKAFPDYNCSQEEAFRDFSKSLFSFIQDEMRTGTLSSQYWKDLNKKYKWKLEFEDPGISLYNFSADCINVEYWHKESDEGRLQSFTEKAIPAELTLLFKHDKDPLQYKIYLTFEPAIIGSTSKISEEEYFLNHMNRNKELMRLFDNFYKEAGEQQATLLLDFNDEMTELKVYLKTDSLKMEIPGCKIEIFSSDKWKL